MASASVVDAVDGRPGIKYVLYCMFILHLRYDVISCVLNVCVKCQVHSALIFIKCSLIADYAIVPLQYGAKLFSKHCKSTLMCPKNSPFYFCDHSVKC